jgi:hypothetical protein
MCVPKSFTLAEFHPSIAAKHHSEFVHLDKLLALFLVVEADNQIDLLPVESMKIGKFCFNNKTRI